MSVLTGIGPQELLALDGEMFDALVSAAEERWLEEGEPEQPRSAAEARQRLTVGELSALPGLTASRRTG